METTYSQKALVKFVQDNQDKIEYVETIKIDKIGFNTYQGNLYKIKLRLVK